MFIVLNGCIYLTIVCVVGRGMFNPAQNASHKKQIVGKNGTVYIKIAQSLYLLRDTYAITRHTRHACHTWIGLVYNRLEQNQFTKTKSAQLIVHQPLGNIDVYRLCVRFYSNWIGNRAVLCFGWVDDGWAKYRFIWPRSKQCHLYCTAHFQCLNLHMRIICPRNVFSKILIFLLCLSFSISENTSRIINLKRSPLFAFNTHLVITVSVNVYMYLGTRIYDFRMYENYNICTTDWVLGLLACLLLTFHLYRLMQLQLWYELK